MNEEQINNLIEQLRGSPFWQTIDFYIFLILGLGSLYFSWKASREAEEAKKAAGEAGKAVKRQADVYDISEISKLCILDENITYPEASNKLNEIIGKIGGIKGMYTDDLKDKNQLIENIENCVTEIRSSLNTINPQLDAYKNPDEDDNITYYTIEAHFGDLTKYINELKGFLESKLIKN